MKFPSSRYDLVDNEEKFELSVDVPGVKMEDIDVTLDEEGYITVRGQRMARDNSSRVVSTFSQSFTLDPTVDIEQFSATLNDGVLVVTAPKDLKRLEENIRRTPIMKAEGITDDGAEVSISKEEGESSEEGLNIENNDASSSSTENDADAEDEVDDSKII